MRYGVIFPGCGVAYLGNERSILSEYSSDLAKLLLRAKKVVDIHEDLFSAACNDISQNELQSQYGTYIYSCAMSNLLRERNVDTACCAGYSMGMYAALFHAESVSFEDGIQILHHQYKLMQAAARDLKFGLGVVIGLPYGDVRKIISLQTNAVEMINVNNKLNTVIAGKNTQVAKILQIARKQGAIKAVLLPLSLPYHTRFMTNATIEYKRILKRYVADADADGDYKQLLNRIEINEPKKVIISAIDQKALTTRNEVVDALTDNLSKNINWMKTMQLMVDAGITRFVECGPGKSLTTMGRFIEGNFRIYNMSSISKLFGSSERRDWAMPLVPTIPAYA